MKGGGRTTGGSDKAHTGRSLNFSDNSREVIDSISAPYDKAIRADFEIGMTFDDYTSGSSEINDVARFGKLQTRSWNSNNVDDWKEAIKYLDKAIDKMPRLSRNVDMFRASHTLGDFSLNGKSVSDIKKYIGRTFTDKGYTSFSMDRNVAKGLSGKNDFIIVFKAKAGQKGVSLANTSAYNTMERQEEFLTSRGTSFTILGAKTINGQKYLFVR